MISVCLHRRGVSRADKSREGNENPRAFQGGKSMKKEGRHKQEEGKRRKGEEVKTLVKGSGEAEGSSGRIEPRRGEKSTRVFRRAQVLY